MRTCTWFVAILALMLGACSGEAPQVDRREFTLQGQILSVSADHTQAVVKHEDIPGFMAAMTMPYHARDPKDFESLKPGDLITATLVVLTSDAYLEKVRKVGEAPVAPAAAGGAAPVMMDLLPTGQPVPAVTLIDQDGRSFGLDRLHGSAVILTFTYTTCPLPDMCPLVDKRFAEIQSRLKTDGNQLRTRLLTVTIDPARDTAATLKAYARTMGADPSYWTMATGDAKDIDQWASRFGVSVSRAANDPTDITHNLRTMIIDRQGNLVQSYSGTSWTPEQMLADVRVMVGID